GAWKTLNEQEQAAFAKQIAGVNHFSALQTIMNGLSDSAKESGMSFNDYASALEKCDGTAQGMATTMIDNLAGDMTILDSSIDGVKIALSEKLNPIMRDLVQYIIEKMPEIQKSSEKALDTVVVIAEWCKKNMPEIKKKLGDVLPLITTIGTGFVSWKSAITAQTAIKGLIDVVKSLNTAMLANPAAAVAAGIATLGTAIGLCVVQAKTDVSELQKISEEVDKEFSEKTQRIDDIKEKINDLNSSFYDSASAIDHEFDRTEILKKELDKLVGKNDEVLSANKTRVDYILGELNQALGTEYTMTGNQIENYQELSKEIDKIIEKKQAEALLNAALANSADLLQEQERLKQEHRTAVADRENAKLEEEQAEENYKAIKDETGISSAEFVNRYGEYFEKGNKSAKIAYYDKNGDIAHKTITREDYQLADAVERANQEYQKALTNEALSREAWNAVSEQTKQLYEALALKESGEYKEATNLMLGESSDFNAETATEDEMLTEYRRQKKNLQGDWRLYRDSKNQSEIDDYLYETVANIDLGQKIGTSLVPLDELLDAETISHLQQLANKNFNLSVLTEFGKDSGIDITQFLGNDYSKIFSNQIQEDYNVDDMLEWIGNSEKEIAKESWEDFKTYVYKEIEKNEKYDITPILKAAKKAGIDVGEAFGGDYMDLVQKQINEGLDPTELIKWFSETDEKAAKYFKENYKDVTQTLIDEGYDPTQMLLQFAETDKEFAKNFKENGIDVVQGMLDKGFNPIGLMQWFFNNEVDITKSFTDKMKK
ncbi:MAG: phage tail tape measure protein, partial [Ruminococcus sp.]|nr:phage tail tape measure protein [Ruminococcus sp.]